MKKTLNLFTLFLCMTTLVIGTISCDDKKREEAIAKAQQECEQLTTPDAVREYLKGQTFVYCEDYHFIWVKLTFLDLDLVEMYNARSKDRSWGSCMRFTYKLREATDHYGKHTGYYIKLEKTNDHDYAYYTFFTFEPGISYYSKKPYAYISLSITPKDSAMGEIYDSRTVYLEKCAADYIPSKWID